MKTFYENYISFPARTKTIKALTSRLLSAKTTPLIYDFMKHFTLESASLHSILGKNVVNLQTFYFSILSYGPFFRTFRGPLSGNGLSLEPCVPFTVYFYSFHTQSHLLHISPYAFFAYVWRARIIFSSLMIMFIGESLEYTTLPSPPRKRKKTLPRSGFQCFSNRFYFL